MSSIESLLSEQPKKLTPGQPFSTYIPEKRGVVLGVGHFNNPESRLFPLAVTAFRAVTKNPENITVVTEGQLRDVGKLTPEEAVRKEQDPGLYAALSRDQGIEEVVSGEAPTTWVDQQLITQYGEPLTALATAARFGHQYTMGVQVGAIHPDMSFMQYLETDRQRYQESMQGPLKKWLNESTLEKLWKEYFPDSGPFDPNADFTLPDGTIRGPDFYRGINSPILANHAPNPGPLGKLAATFGNLRRVYLVELAENIHNQGRMPLITTGAQHAAAMRRAIPERLGAHDDRLKTVQLIGYEACEKFYTQLLKEGEGAR